MPMTEDSMKKRTTQDQSEYSGPLKWIDHNQNGIMDAYEDPRLPVEARIADLLPRLSIEEKIAYLCIDWTSGAPPAEATVPADTQRKEGCTQFPASIGQAASWNPEYWINTYQGLVVPRVVMAFGAFLMRQFFQSIPKELEEAAFIDGCNRLRCLVQIAVPLSGPAVATLAIFAFTNSWNEFMWPLITTTKAEIRTIQVALAVMRFSGMASTDPWSQVFAVATLASLPTLIVYLLFQRHFIKGIVMTGLKG